MVYYYSSLNLTHYKKNFFAINDTSQFTMGFKRAEK